MTDDSKPEPAPSGDYQERLGQWPQEALVWWHQMPNKVLFFMLLAVWLAFFHWLGNSTFGYEDTPSLFGWMRYTYSQAEDDQHCKYIPLVVLGLAWWKRKELMAAPKRPWWPALSLVVLGWPCTCWGSWSNKHGFPSWPSLSALRPDRLGVGRAWLQASFFPYLLFAFCVPLATVQDTLTFPLRLIVTKISVGLADGLGIDAVRRGAQIIDPSGKFEYEVAAACSGIRSLTALTALSAIYAFMTFKAGWRKLAILVAAIPLASRGMWRGSQLS